MSFTEKIKSLMNLAVTATEVEFDIMYNIDKLTITITLIDKRATKPDAMRWILFSDDNLKAGLYNFTGIAEPTTANEIMQNYVVNPSLTWTPQMMPISYNVDLHTTKHLYLLASIGEFRSITNFDWTGATVLKKIQMNVPYNETLFSNVVMQYDCTHVGSQSFNIIKFKLVNSKGLEPKLTTNFSVSLIFAIQT